VLGFPPLLVGCGGGDDDSSGGPAPTPTPIAGSRELRTLHFDFSSADLTDLELRAARSSSHRRGLSIHTEESRAHFRDLNPLLAGVPDEQLTHYAEDVDLPSDALQHIFVMGRLSNTGEAVLAGLHIHVPAEVMRVSAEFAAAAGFGPQHSAKIRAYGLEGIANQLPVDLQLQINDFVNPYDTAISLVFHHPEIMNLDVQQGTSILQLIQSLPCNAGDTTCQPFLGELAMHIGESWPATESGLTPSGTKAWAQLLPMTQFDGTPVVDDNGNPQFRYDLAAETVAAAANTIKQVLQSIFDDEQYEGNNWHATQGITSEPAQTTELGSSASIVAGQASRFKMTASSPTGSTAHGVNFVDVSVINQSTRTVQIELKNRYLRFLSAFVAFANAGGTLSVANPTEDDTSRSKFLSHVVTNDQILGIPLQGDDVATTTLQFDVPAEATEARVIFGSLGLGGDAFSPEATYGSTNTLVFNLGIPTLFLAAGVGLSASEGFSSLFKDASLLTRVARVAKEALLDGAPDFVEGIFSTGASNDASSFLSSMGNIVVQAVLSAVPEVVSAVGVELGVTEAFENAGLVGLAVKVISVAADLAALGETVGEVLTNPAVFENKLTLTRDLTVSILKDPNDFQFPAEARTYSITLAFGDKRVLSPTTGAIQQGRVDPIDVVFHDIPAGGSVQADVVLRTDDGTVVGLGSLAPQLNDKDQIEVAIVEKVLPLTSETKYQHALKLEYQNGQHVWSPAAAPTATQVDLCQGEDDALCTLHGITISQRTGMAGYGFQAGGQTVPFCAGGNGTMNVVQNIFLGTDPDRGRKALPCGYPEPVGIVYDRLGPASGLGRNFFLQPDEEEKLVLRSLVLDDSTPFDNETRLAWGRFSSPLVSLAVHPSGLVVGVDRVNHRMEILQLPPQAVDQEVAPQATPFAFSKSGRGRRRGLMIAPVAVNVSQGAILVLEAGNRRIQAFDVLGNSTDHFDSNGSPFVELNDPASDVEYLDLAADGVGFLYVLSFVGSGRNVEDYFLDIYEPQGMFLTRTRGVAAARIAVDTFRNVYTLNYETIANAPNVEPSLSQWEPSS
jgi:hypothetical protein